MTGSVWTAANTAGTSWRAVRLELLPSAAEHCNGGAQGLAVVVRVEVPVAQPMPYVALLQPSGSQAQWLVTLSPERRLIRVSEMGDFPMDAARESLELWVIGEDGKPLSLGLLPAKGEGDMPMPRGMPMPKKPALAVSREPPGGSPTGQPTGPVIVVGPAQRAS